MTNDLRAEEEIPFYCFQDYYSDGELCGATIDLSKEKWTQVNAMIENLKIPEHA